MGMVSGKIRTKEWINNITWTLIFVISVIMYTLYVFLPIVAINTASQMLGYSLKCFLHLPHTQNGSAYTLHSQRKFSMEKKGTEMGMLWSTVFIITLPFIFFFNLKDICSVASSMWKATCLNIDVLGTCRVYHFLISVPHFFICKMAVTIVPTVCENSVSNIYKRFGHC